MARIRFQIHDDPRPHRRGAYKPATLSGVHYNDLRSIFTAAALFAYAELERAMAQGDERKIAYQRHRLALLGAIQRAVNEGIEATYPKQPKRPPSKEERKRKVLKDNAFRKTMNKLIADTIKETFAE